MKTSIGILFLLFAVPAQAEFPFQRAQGNGRATVTSESDRVVGYLMGISSLLRQQVSVEMEFDEAGKQSVIQHFKIGGLSWQNRFDVIWKFQLESLGQKRFQLINTADGQAVGTAFCNTTSCEYEMILSEPNLKISERIEWKTDSQTSFDLMGTVLDLRSGWGKLQLYYRIRMLPF